MILRLKFDPLPTRGDVMNNKLSDWLASIPRWEAILLFFAFFILIFTLQRIAFHFMKKYADKTSNYWDNVFVDALRFPVIFFLISLAVALLPVLFKLSNQAEKFTVFSSKFFTVLGFALFVQKLLLFVLQLFLVKKDSLRTYTGITRVGISGLIYTFFILIFLDTAGIFIFPFFFSLGGGGPCISFALP